MSILVRKRSHQHVGFKISCHGLKLNYYNVKHTFVSDSVCNNSLRPEIKILSNYACVEIVNKICVYRRWRKNACTGKIMHLLIKANAASKLHTIDIF